MSTTPYGSHYNSAGSIKCLRRLGPVCTKRTFYILVQYNIVRRILLTRRPVQSNIEPGLCLSLSLRFLSGNAESWPSIKNISTNKKTRFSRFFSRFSNGDKTKNGNSDLRKNDRKHPCRHFYLTFRIDERFLMISSIMLRVQTLRSTHTVTVKN